MTKKYSIRRPRPDEIPGIVTLVKNAYLEFKPHLTKQVWDDWMEYVGHSLDEHINDTIVAEYHGKIVGVVQLVPPEKERVPKNSAVQRLLAVRKDARGLGYGELLIEECLRLAAKKGLAAVFLWTNAFMKSAICLYERMGFKRAPKFDIGPLGPDDDTIAYRYRLR